MPQNLDFNSFWMAGFEGADHVNGLGHALDMARSNRHVEHADEDYARAFKMGMRTVRESVGWRLSESRDGEIDLSRAMHFGEAARRQGVQIVWSLMHYGMPEGLLVTDDDFAARFARFAGTFARAMKPLFSDEAPIYNPINEIGFMAWAVSATNLMDPYRNESTESSLASGFDVKCRLVNAALQGMAAILEEDPRARFLHVEPIVHVVAPPEQPELEALASEIRGYQWQTWDLISGRLCPELGGHLQALDLIGVNHYASSQWEAGTEDRICWHLADPRWMPLSTLLREAWARYGRPLIVAETSHIGAGRADWLHDVGASASAALAAGVDLRGVCLYPAIDRHDWSDASHWHNSGLWDVDLTPGGPMSRRLHWGYAKALRRWQQRIERQTSGAPFAT